MVVQTLQGTYYVVTGIWPLLHMKSFEAVSGEKTDKWLVKMVGLLFASIGVVLLAASDDSMKLLGLLSATSAAGIDIFYSLKGVIPKIYLTDAAIQVIIVLAWLIA